MNECIIVWPVNTTGMENLENLSGLGLKHKCAPTVFSKSVIKDLPLAVSVDRGNITVKCLLNLFKSYNTHHHTPLCPLFDPSVTTQPKSQREEPQTGALVNFSNKDG